MLVENLKMNEAERASRDALNNKTSMWNCFRKSKPQPKPSATNISEDEWSKHYSSVFGSKDPGLESASESKLKIKLEPLL